MRQEKSRPWWSANRGNVAILTGLMLIPLMVASGFAVDLHRSVTTKQRIQKATDLAALYAAHVLRDLSAAERRPFRQASRKVFNQHKKGLYGDVTCDYNSTYKRNAGGVDGGWVKIESTCQIPTIFGLSISGKDKIEVSATSYGRIARTTLDLALVLDISNSMDGWRLDAVKVAATDMIDDLIKPLDDVRISIVPYESSINPGTYGYDALGFETTDTDSVVDPERDGRDKFCVTERLGGQAFTDAAPSAGRRVGAPNTLTDGCTVTELMPLSDDATALKARVAALDATVSGPTAGHIGIAWGWYTLSPNWGSIWPIASNPVPYGNPSELKVMVLMTDGDFNLYNWLASPAPDTAPDQARKLCAAMKAEGIVIFSIAFDAPASAQSLMQDCATSNEHYFNASTAADLDDAFESITDRFAGTRVAPS